MKLGEPGLTVYILPGNFLYVIPRISDLSSTFFTISHLFYIISELA
jgi:hypothetical protein